MTLEHVLMHLQDVERRLDELERRIEGLEHFPVDLEGLREAVGNLKYEVEEMQEV